MKFPSMTARAQVTTMTLLAFSTLSAFSLPAHNVPNGVAIASYQGRVDPAKEMNLTVVLKMHNRADFDKAVEELYDSASPTYHQWFTDKDFEKYKPTVAEYETVKSELSKKGFSVVSEDPQRFTVRVHGTAATVEKAFQTELYNMKYNGRTFQSHVRDAQLAGPAADLVEAISGIERHVSTPRLSVAKNPMTGKSLVKVPLSTKAQQNSFVSSLTDAPLTEPVTLTLTTTGSATPAAQYTGLGYSVNGQTAAFTPSQLEAHYGVPFTYNGKKYDGHGQTIALVEAYGYANAEADANTAASLFGLPALTSSNFSVIYPEGMPLNPNAASLTGWDGEIALDIQSAHAIAPGANILVVASSGQDNEDQINSLQYVRTHNLAHTVSSSWENDNELISGSLEEDAFNTVLEQGTAAGISYQFSSGDNGDVGLGTPVGAVGVPSNSPYATAVGGTSILNIPGNSKQIVTGWGNDIVYLYDYGIEDPLVGEFYFGGGGGQSQYFAKPSYQKGLPGSWRQVPDVAALADPFTGFALVLTVGNTQTGQVIGGTSLASPIFTGLWAIADQLKGAPLGQAAVAVSKLKAGEILDVIPPSTTANPAKHDVTGSLTDASGTTNFTATSLFTDAEDLAGAGNLTLYGQKAFLSAIWPVPDTNDELFLALSFGTDSSLTVTTGWDNVTGWGEPNGLPFFKAVTGK